MGLFDHLKTSQGRLLLPVPVIGALCWICLTTPSLNAQTPPPDKATTRTGKTQYIIPPPLEDLKRDYKVRLVYFVPSDREVKKNYRDKIDVLMRVVADIYRRDLKANGHKSRGLDFEFDQNGKLVVHLIKGKHNSIHYTGKPYKIDHFLKTTIAETTAQVGPPNHRACLIFSEAGGIAEAQPAYPYCGFAMVSADMLRDEVTATTIEKQIAWMFDDTPVRRVDGAQKVPRKTATQVSNGVLIHELGHIFYLLHDTSDTKRNIMAYGYHQLGKMFDRRTAAKRDVRFSPAHARVAVTSRFLSETFDENDIQEPKAKLTMVRQPKPGETTIQFKLTASDNKGLRAAICLQRGGGQIDALVGGVTLSGTTFDQVLTFKCPRPLAAGQPLIYILNVVDVNGNCTQIMQQSAVAKK
jgi:hypothetical protein